MILIEFNGKIACLSEHCRDLNVSYNVVKRRHHRTGEPYEKCLEHYQNNGVNLWNLAINFGGKIASLREHCKDLGINCTTVQSRHKRTDESYEECLEYYKKYGISRKYKVKNKRLYKIWVGTKQKCENPNHTAYKDYGGRGIKVCERWQIYENFENDLLDSYLNHVEQYGIKETTIDRWPNNDGDYEPNNVRWATRKEQANNRRSNHMVTEELNCTQFAEKYNINYETVRGRLSKGWSVEEIINTSTEKTKYYLPCNNGTKSLLEHCIKNDYCYRTIASYIKKYNLQPHEALAKWLKKK